jgi:competence protein ComGC|nr:hypothetical protein [Neorhizobium tomejilense]
MFQLIVAVIAIALVIALTLASIFYGGEAFTRSSLKANVAALVNQAQQISGAHTLYKTDFSANAPSVDELEAQGYLAEIPSAPRIVAVDGVTGDKAEWELEFNTGVGSKDYVHIALPTDAASFDPIAQAVSDNGAGQAVTDGTDARFQFPL